MLVLAEWNNWLPIRLSPIWLQFPIFVLRSAHLSKLAHLSDIAELSNSESHLRILSHAVSCESAAQPVQNLNERDKRESQHEAKESTNLMKCSHFNLQVDNNIDNRACLPVTDSQSMSIVGTAGIVAPKANPSRHEPWRCLLRMQSRPHPWRFASMRCLSQ